MAEDKHYIYIVLQLAMIVKCVWIAGSEREGESSGGEPLSSANG